MAPLVYREKGEKIGLLQCLGLIESIKNENSLIAEQLKKINEFDGTDFTNKMELNDSFHENAAFIGKLSGKVLGILNETELDSYYTKTRDRIDKNIRDAKAALAERDSEVGKYFQFSIIKDKAENVHTRDGRTQFLKKWQHRPKTPITWKTK